MWNLLLALALMQSSGGGPTITSQSAPTSSSKPTTFSDSELAIIKTRAAVGDIKAEMDLAEAYETGSGVPANDELAAQWCRKAAEQGYARAQNHLGTMYRMGIGVEKNKEEAVNWYRKAARQKYANAMFNLGTAYYNGDGVQSNDVVSGAWFLLAEDSGSDAAKDAVARIMNDMSLGQVLASFEKVAVMFRKGDEVPHSDAEAAKWYRKAADKGDASANVELAQQLVEGLGVQQDYPEARRRCGDAAKAGFGPGAYCLALMDREGLGGPKDFEQAARWFGEAANLQDVRALLFLGDMYLKGEGVKQNKEIAYMWYWIAANSGIKEAAQSEERLKQEMDKKTVERAQRKAMEWSGKHQQLMPRRRPNS
jgi:TPR repeat protein